MRAISVILKKEFARFFGDKKMAFTTILLPGLMIYIMYTIMGNAISGQFTSDDTYVPTVAVESLPESVDLINSTAKIFDFTETNEADGMEMLRGGEADIFVCFPEDFDSLLPVTPVGTDVPEVEIYYNSADVDSSAAYEMLSGMLSELESSAVDVFGINTAPDGEYDIASDEEMSGMIFSSMMPMLLIMLLFSGCMAVAPESIAGEKERGTMASMLVTPAGRGQIALGKIIALSVIALLSGTSSFIGTVLSIPKLMGGGEEISTNVYGAGDYAVIGVVVLSTVLLFVVAISMISAVSKSVKEAQSYVVPLMLVAMGAGISAMFGGGAGSELWRYLVPIYNSVQSMVSVFSFTVSPVNIAVCVSSNVIYAGVGAFVLAKMFGSEKIMFGK